MVLAPIWRGAGSDLVLQVPAHLQGGSFSNADSRPGPVLQGLKVTLHFRAGSAVQAKRRGLGDPSREGRGSGRGSGGGGPGILKAQQEVIRGLRVSIPGRQWPGVRPQGNKLAMFSCSVSWGGKWPDYNLLAWEDNSREGGPRPRPGSLWSGWAEEGGMLSPLLLWF